MSGLSLNPVLSADQSILSSAPPSGTFNVGASIVAQEAMS